MKDDVVRRQQQTPKRERLLSAEAEAKLRKLLMRRLGAGRKTLQIEKCFSPFGLKPRDDDEVPDQVLVFKEHHEDVFVRESADYDEALIFLLGTDLELEEETRHYIAHKLQRPHVNIRFYPTLTASREFALCIGKCKELLRQGGLKALKAEEEIAQALGISVETLRKRCQRGSKPA